MELYVELFVFYLQIVFSLRDWLEKGAFGKFAATGVFRFFWLTAVRPRSFLFLEQVSFYHIIDVLFVV